MINSDIKKIALLRNFLWNKKTLTSEDVRVLRALEDSNPRPFGP